MFRLHSVIGSREQVVGVDLSVGNDRKLTELLRRGHGESLGPWERATLIERRRADGGRAERFTVGANSKRLTLFGAELVKSFVIGGESDGTGKGVLDSVEVTLLRIDGQAVPDDLERVLRHVGEDIKEALAVEDEVGEQRIRGRRNGEGVALEEHVEHADANSPDVGLCSGVASIGGVVLLRSHVAVAANSNLPRPGIGSSKTKVAKLHGAILGEEDVLRLDVAVVDALGVNELHSTNQLHHEVADVLGLQGTLVEANGLVQVAIGAILQHQVDVVLRLERLKKVDHIGVIAEAKVDAKLLGALVDGEGRRAVDSSRRLGDNLDGDKLVSGQVLSLEDHAKGAMVEGRDGLVSAMEYNTCLELITHTLHEEGCYDELQERSGRSSGESTRS